MLRELSSFLELDFFAQKKSTHNTLPSSALLSKTDRSVVLRLRIAQEQKGCAFNKKIYTSSHGNKYFLGRVSWGKRVDLLVGFEDTV